MQEFMAMASGWLKPAIDILLILGISMLWITWLRNGARQKRLEQLLLECASQLEEATRHLDEATSTIEKVKREQEMQSYTPKAAAKTTPAPRQPIQQPEPPLPSENSTQATMVMRMHREGEKPEAIADKLDMPLAQVKLLLKLYATKAKA